MTLITSILTGGTNNHVTTSEEANRFTTNFVTAGVVGTITSTSGLAPMTGSFAINAQSTPDKTINISGGDIVVGTTPAGQALQNLTTRNSGILVRTVSDNSSGSTQYDWVYVVNDPTIANNPSTLGDTVSSIVFHRSSSSSTDSLGTPANSQLLAIITVVSGFTSITNSTIKDMRTLAGAAVPPNSIGATSLSTSAITLGYAQITGNVTLTAPTSDTLITGLTLAVTIPTGGRRVKITAYTPALFSSNPNASTTLSVWDGAVGTGTQLQSFTHSSGTVASDQLTANLIAVVTPSAGSKTYNLGMKTTAGNAVCVASNTAPAFILVEAI